MLAPEPTSNRAETAYKLGLLRGVWPLAAAGKLSDISVVGLASCEEGSHLGTHRTLVLRRVSDPQAERGRKRTR